MAKKGDMLYAWTNDAEIKKKAELGGAVTALWKHALESKMVDAVLAITEGDGPLRCPAGADHRPQGTCKDRRITPLRYPPSAQDSSRNTLTAPRT